MKLQLTAIFLFITALASANNPLKIKVLDENKEPLTGVKITAVEEAVTLFTDFDGVGELSQVQSPKVYRVEYAGYESGYIKITASDKEDIKITLRKSGL
ncbi:MAG: hypothetical protein ACI9GO_000992 [Bacteroidia bacterium]